MEKIRAIIFDLDGVLVSTDHFHYLAWEKVTEGLEITFNQSINDLLRGVSRMESLDIILRKNDLTLSDEEKNQIAEEKNHYYKQFLEAMSPEDVDKEVIDTLEELKHLGIKMAIGSSSKNALFILKQTKLLDYFDAISDGRNITKSKPHPEVFLKAAMLLLEKPEHCLVVEDAEAGIVAAKRANMLSVGINHVAELGLANYTIQSFGEIRSILKEII